MEGALAPKLSDKDHIVRAQSDENEKQGELFYRHYKNSLRFIKSDLYNKQCGWFDIDLFIMMFHN